MMSGKQIYKKYRQQSLAIIILAIIAALLIGFFAANLAGDIAERDLRDKAQETLSIQVETLTGQLDKYSLLSATIARRSDIAELFIMPNIEKAASQAKQVAIQSSALSGALNVAFIRPNGEVLAFGLNVPIKKIAPSSPMMIAALEGRLGRQVNILSEQKRAYTFATSVRKNQKPVGVVAIYVNLDELEENWSLSKMPILAIDNQGAIIMSNRSQLRLETLTETSTKTGRFLNIKIDNHYIEHLDYVRFLPLTGWELHVLANIAPIKIAKIFWGLFSGFLTILIAAILHMLLNRQIEITRKARNERATSLRLERTIRERTKELTKTNETLAHEVEERKLAEQQLRKTQNELIQTGKLAALGQMSASLAHEYNQPLSATKSYANNAIKYLDLKRTKEAKDNISRISGLVDRMGEISKHLRNFARKPNISFGAIAINRVVEEALEIMSARLNEGNTKVNLNLPKENIYVLAGHLRLQQVMVNLIANALDAMAKQNNPIIDISIKTTTKQIFIHFIDNGTGIKQEDITTIFDPFFTTKQIGEGLGLGLSISYNIIKDFGGLLSARNNKTHGAEFIIRLERKKHTNESAKKNKGKNDY